ncbi:ATP-grasp domain-containing protein [Parafrankia discariae]|uniref:ATP-grasp domain-containing protein n=1 Tax=Parafrankia discariae TaxID=365528 RepID=UPI00035FCF4B|nr:ATP-grasp domain-containing protein [Parafrankia discariae]
MLGSHQIPSTPFLQACDAVIDEPPGEGDEFVEQALAACRRHGVDVFVPGRNMLDVAARVGEFEAAGVRVMCSPAASARIFTTKSGQYAAMAARGLPVPRTRTVTTFAQFEAACAELSAAGGTVCVKPDVDHGGQGFRIIDGDAERLTALFEPPSVRVSPATLERILGRAGSFPALVVGEYLGGPEFSVDVLSRPAPGTGAAAPETGAAAGPVAVPGSVLAAVPRGKDGLPWTRNLRADAAVTELATRVVEAFGLAYLNNVQIRYRGATPVLLEVNTRAASGTYQSAATGLNLPWFALALLLGEPVEVGSPDLPQTLIAYNEAMVMRPLDRLSPRPRGHGMARDAARRLGSAAGRVHRRSADPDRARPA